MTDKPNKRRTKAEMEALRGEIYRVCAEHQPLTIRQAFYRLVVEGVIPKTQQAYKGTVIRLIGQMRDAGEMPFRWIVDNTRMMRKPKTWAGLGQMLESNKEFYRRDVWAAQDAYVEIWCESDSAAGVVSDVTRSWDVPLMSARGFSSKTFLHAAASVIRRESRPTYLYYFGDFDPSGVHIDRNICEGLCRYGAEDFEFSRVAVTEQQIEEWRLPGTPPKKGDSRSRNFQGDAVELEAISPADLREVCRNCIEQHIDQDAHERTLVVERAERDTLAQFAASLEEAG